MMTGAARVAGVMGWPVRHSLSPLLHGHWLKALGIDGAYVPFAVRPDDLEAALAALRPLGIAGVNLTVPHKERALPLMAELDEAARRIGAVNTVTVHGTNLCGMNTDGYGFLENLKEAAPGWRPENGAAVVLGAGGAARAVVHALMTEGVPEIRLVNRTPARAEALARDFALKCPVFALSDMTAAFPGASLLVNATSLGMTGMPPLAVDLDGLPDDGVVCDLVYVPLETGLLAAARARGLVRADGLGMLIHQAVPAFEAFYGVRPPVTADLRERLLRTPQTGG